MRGGRDTPQSEELRSPLNRVSGCRRRRQLSRESRTRARVLRTPRADSRRHHHRHQQQQHLKTPMPTPRVSPCAHLCVPCPNFPSPKCVCICVCVWGIITAEMRFWKKFLSLIREPAPMECQCRYLRAPACIRPMGRTDGTFPGSIPAVRKCTFVFSN